jgi:DinB family protein
MNSYLERLQRELDEAVGHAEAGDLVKAPAGKWSAAQILEHLFLTYLHTNRGLARCLEQGAPLATRATLKDRLATLLVVNLGYFPGGRKAPERSVPRGMAPEEVRQALAPELYKMSAGLDDCERKFGVRTKILDHPILGPLTADEWSKFHWVHGRHHARQIRERIGKS